MQSFDRRTFIKTLAVTGAAVAAAPLVLRALPAQADAAGEKVGLVGDFEVGIPKKVTLARGASIFVTKQSDGTFTALSSACTHRGCELLWVPTRSDFECPCHGGRFSKTGAVLGGPPPRALPSYPAKVVSGAVYVQA